MATSKNNPFWHIDRAIGRELRERGNLKRAWFRVDYVRHNGERCKFARIHPMPDSKGLNPFTVAIA